MEVTGMKNLLKRVSAALLLFFVAFNVFAQNGLMNLIPGTTAGIFNSGNNHFGILEDASRDIKISVRKTQGVAFVGTAVPEGDAVGQPVSLDYDVNRDDGDRLHVTIGAATVNSGLYDWEIVPLARWANGNYTAAVTFVGGATDNDDQTLIDRAKTAKDEGKRVFWISYHPDLANTLVGYNLFLVDAMLCGAPINTKIKDFTDRSKNDTFPVIKGYNDYAYPSDESTAAEFSQEILEKRTNYYDTYHDENSMMPYTTYIYSDGEIPITYQLNGDKIVFAGYPVYHDMVYESNTWALTLTKGKSVMLDSLPLREKKLTPKFSNRLLRPITITSKTWPDVVDPSGVLLYLLMFDSSKYVLLERCLDMGYELEDIKFVEANFEPVSELVEFMRMKESYEAMKLVNPVVFNSAERSCHWLAFFRSVKGDHENKTAEWESFIKAVNARYPEGSEDPAYSYKTPRLWVAD
jgi:hypothetical protein